SVAVKMWRPSVSVLVATRQAPLASAVAVPIDALPSYRLTVLLAAAVPVTVSTLASVTSAALPVSGEKGVMVGVAGAGATEVDACGELVADSLSSALIVFPLVMSMLLDTDQPIKESG